MSHCILYPQVALIPHTATEVAYRAEVRNKDLTTDVLHVTMPSLISGKVYLTVNLILIDHNVIFQSLHCNSINYPICFFLYYTFQYVLIDLPQKHSLPSKIQISFHSYFLHKLLINDKLKE